MKKIIALSFVLLFVSNVFAQDTAKHKVIGDLRAYVKSESERLVGKEFPQFDIRTGDSSFSNADLKNKIVFVNFWFTDCPPCMAEIKGLNEMYNKLKDSKDFMFVSFTFDADSTSNKTISKYGIRYPVFRTDKPECKRLNFGNGFPTSFILDRNGIIRFFTAGGDVDEDNATEDVLAILYPKILEQL